MFNHITHSFPTIVQENTENGRFYVTPNGQKYPSITTILSAESKDGIDAWRKKVGDAHADKISRNAATRGTAVHAIIEKYLNNEDVSRESIMPNAKSLFIRMKPELHKLNNIHCLEQRLYSHELGLAGTVDCIAEHDGVLSVIDFKTSAKIKKVEYIKNYFMQGAAYSKMFYDMTSVKIDKVVILIGVDESNFCQTMIENPWNHIVDLKRCIENYHRGKRNGN
ncbi:hypothetical protein UFOVP49_29 [uncultured Caudovirales phage]|uniref:PD-(D/E)XK nuclease superfamily n=1 Tax=uncultured Caudovirales phage TaxID=2100421 RepID=A0A6J5KP60_9CAUD|nr:hypothetical protein UFOVP49_29 [uncultured Caudovirales phage]